MSSSGPAYSCVAYKMSELCSLNISFTKICHDSNGLSTAAQLTAATVQKYAKRESCN